MNKFMIQIETLRMRVLRGLLDPALTKDAVDNLTYMVQNRSGE